MRRSLLLNVLFDHCQRRAAAAGDEVAAAPQHGFPEELLEMRRVVSAHQPGSDSLQAVHGHGQRDLGRQLDEQMKMVGLAVEFQQLPFLHRELALADEPQLGEHGAGEALSPILCHDNQVILKRVSAVVAGLERLLWNKEARYPYR